MGLFSTLFCIIETLGEVGCNLKQPTVECTLVLKTEPVGYSVFAHNMERCKINHYGTADKDHGKSNSGDVWTQV